MGLDFLSGLAGAAQGFERASQTLFNAKVKAFDIEEEARVRRLDIQQKKLQIEKLKNSLDPETLDLASKKIQLESKDLESKIKERDFTLKFLTGRADESAGNLIDFARAAETPGARVSAKLGAFTVSQAGPPRETKAQVTQRDLDTELLNIQQQAAQIEDIGERRRFVRGAADELKGDVKFNEITGAVSTIDRSLGTAEIKGAEFKEFVDFISTAPTKEEALTEVQNNRNEIVSKFGEDGFAELTSIAQGLPTGVQAPGLTLERRVVDKITSLIRRGGRLVGFADDGEPLVEPPPGI